MSGSELLDVLQSLIGRHLPSMDHVAVLLALRAAPDFVYILCAITSFACAVLLLRAYRRTAVRLLLWSGLCFACFALNNLLLIIDLPGTARA